MTKDQMLKVFRRTRHFFVKGSQDAADAAGVNSKGIKVKYMVKEWKKVKIPLSFNVALQSQKKIV